MPRLNTLLQCAAALLPLLGPMPACAQVAAPAGWTTQVERTSQRFSPPDLAPIESFDIAVFAAQGAPASVPAWLSQQVGADATAMSARVERSGELRTVSATLLSTTRVLRATRGTPLIAIYFAVTRQDAQVQLVRALASSATVLQRYQTATTDVLRSVAAIASPVALAPFARDTLLGAATGSPAPTAATRGTASAPARPPVGVVADEGRISNNMVVRSPAPPRRGIRPGGALVPGMYVGQQISSDTREVLAELTIWLYGNGEYRQQWKRSTKEPREAEFAYDPTTGRIDLEWGSLLDIVNSRIEPNTDFAVVGRSDDRTPMLYAENDRGFRTVMTVMVYAGVNDRPSPRAMKSAAATAEAEAARYKHVVAAGRGVQDAQIAGIVMHSQLHTSVGLSMQMGAYSTRSIYLLLNDGTIHDGLPVPPDELDVPTSRRREPETWGRWRRQGAQVQVAWSVAPNEWTTLQGETMVKARPGDVLRGRFSGGESRAAGDVGSFSLYGVTFGPGQQFETDARGGTGTGGFTQTMSGTSIQTTTDDDGSVTSATTPGAVVSSTTRARGSSRSGTYRISGWNLEARYGDGRVVRQPFFFLDEKRDAMYWQGKVVTWNPETP
jgi:hypothetical protein